MAKSNNTPEKEKEKTIAEIFNLTPIDAPKEKHLEQINPMKAWGGNKKR